MKKTVETTFDAFQKKVKTESLNMTFIFFLITDREYAQNASRVYLKMSISQIGRSSNHVTKTLLDKDHLRHFALT
jgi:hypothetical protein